MFSLSSCSWNVNWVKERAAKRWSEAGYTVVGYEGYLWSFYGGDVWYILQRTDSPGVVYNGYLARWFDEVHIYDVHTLSGNQINLLNK